MSKMIAWVRQPSTLGGIAVLVYLALKTWLPAYVAADVPVIAGALVLIITPDNTAGAAKAAQVAAQIEKLATGAPPPA